MKRIISLIMISFWLCLPNSVVLGQETIWSEDFGYPDGTTTGGGSPPKWTIDISDCDIVPPDDWFEVRSNQIEARDIDGEAIWTSEAINISSYADVSISVEAFEEGTLESSDYLKIYYRIDGGSEILFETNGNLEDDFENATATQTGLNGTNVIIVVRVKNNASTEYHQFDNIVVNGTYLAVVDLAISKMADNSTPAPGDTVTFSIEVLNNGPDNATNITAGDTLPIGLSYLTASASQGNYHNESGIWTIGAFPSNARATLQINVIVASTGSITNYAHVHAGDESDPDLNNNFTSATLTVSAATPVADFQADTTSGIGQLMVQFKNLSANATAWEWDFGDGSTSTVKNPGHEFQYTDCSPGTKKFTVTLKAMGSGGTDIKQQTDYIIIHSPSVANFSANQIKICSGTEITLTNQSCGAIENWELNWGDGTIETGIFPLCTSWKHTYSTSLPTATFSLSLKVWGNGGVSCIEKENYITVHGPIVADFTVDKTAGIAPLEVQFSDLSLGWITWWHWEFGDGSTSDAQHPVHIFSGWPKHVTVKLAVGGPCGEMQITKNDLLTVNHGVKVLFEATPLVGAPGLVVQFTNNAGGNANHFCWDYGDGLSEEFSSDMGHKKHPLHIYRNPGEYTVSLKAWGSGGTDQLVLPGLVYVDSVYKSLKLQLVSAGKTYPGLEWKNAIDQDIFGAGANVLAAADDAWAIFKFADSGIHLLEKIRLLPDMVEAGEITTNFMKDFEVWTALDENDFGAETVFVGTSIQKDGHWEEFLLNKAVRAKFLKLVLTSARGKQAPYRELAEFQVFGSDDNEFAKKGVETMPSATSALPTQLALFQNYPNPFNPQTTIHFELSETATIELSIYDLQGKRIRTLAQGTFQAGSHALVWDARESFDRPVANGVYFYQLKVAGFTGRTLLTRKMIYIK